MGITSIAWTDRTRNLVYGCRKIDIDVLTGACVKCYIWRGLPRYGVNPDILTYLNVQNAIKDFQKWSKDPSIVRIFLNNYSDTFHEEIPFTTIDLWHEKIINAFPNFQFQLLTKRIGRAMLYYRQRGRVPNNIWVGCTIGAKNRLFRLSQLRQIPARVRWVSFEPLLEDLGDFDLKGISWAVCGGESDIKNPRPMDLQWATNLQRICERDSVAFFFKQRGGKGFDGAGGNICPCCNSKHQEFPKVN